MGYPLHCYPEIDYRQHPAYGLLFSKPDLRQRLAALTAFARGLALIGGRWLADYEHLPKPRDKANRVRWMLRRLPTYLTQVVRQRWSRLTAGRRYAPRSAAGQACLDSLYRDGVLALHFDESQRAQLRQLLAQPFDTLSTRLAGLDPAQRLFDENRLWLDAAADSRPYEWMTRRLDDAGVLEAARAYLGRPVGVAHVIPQINTPADTFWGHHFRDVGLAQTRCDYCHFDATYRVLKLIVYLDDVDHDQGPFSYVRGSHRVSAGFLDGMIRRANDYAGLSSTQRAQRQRFMALPRWLQRKAAFGPDILDDSPYVQPILDNEWLITSDQGHAIVFDPQGIHRGGMVRSGHRRVVGVMLAELPPQG